MHRGRIELGLAIPIKAHSHLAMAWLVVVAVLLLEGALNKSLIRESISFP